LDDFQFKLEVPPVLTVPGEAVNVTSGVGERTTTFADCFEAPAVLGFEAAV